MAILPNRPGPQGPNQIAGTFDEQMRRAMVPRDPTADFLVTRAELREQVDRLRRELEELAGAVVALERRSVA